MTPEQLRWEYEPDGIPPPITGRTHQLRVHAAHELGLHCPIVGAPDYSTQAKDTIKVGASGWPLPTPSLPNMGGIHVESQEGKGSTFTIALPADLTGQES